jgi:hypothetical protein
MCQATSARETGFIRVDGADAVAALGGEGDDVAADAARGPEDGDVHGTSFLD